MKTKTEKEILLDAADALEKYGWRQGSLGSLSQKRFFRKQVPGPMCVLGALNFVATGDPLLGANDAPVLETMRQFLSAGLLSQWNDCYCTSQEEAVDVLRNCAANLEEK